MNARLIPDGALEACPECAAGKHRNCDGATYDLAHDDPNAPCPCASAGHPDDEVPR